MKTPLKKSYSTEIQNTLTLEAPAHSNGWLTNLINLGATGYFPIFYKEWLDSYFKANESHKITGKDRKLIMKIKRKLSIQSTFERKRIILSSLPENERNLFIKHFIFLVETQLLDQTPKLH